MAAYAGAYLMIAEPFCGKLGDEFMEFRLFRDPFAYYLFAPAIAIEGALKDHEFYGHIRSGASLPAPADCGAREIWRPHA